MSSIKCANQERGKGMKKQKCKKSNLDIYSIELMYKQWKKCKYVNDLYCDSINEVRSGISNMKAEDKDKLRLAVRRDLKIEKEKNVSQGFEIGLLGTMFAVVFGNLIPQITIKDIFDALFYALVCLLCFIPCLVAMLSIRNVKNIRSRKICFYEEILGVLEDNLKRVV